MNLQDGTTAVLRFVHLDNLAVYLARAAVHASRHAPADGLGWRANHRHDVQDRRAQTLVPTGPGGCLLDYVPFYFGPRSPMLFQLHTGRVAEYTEGQAPLVYLVASAEQIAAEGCRFVFYDGHALAAFSQCFDDLAQLHRVDRAAVMARQWSEPDDPDLQRRKQAEFLVHHHLPWSLVRGIAVLDGEAQRRVEVLLATQPLALRRPVVIRPDWYY